MNLLVGLAEHMKSWTTGEALDKGIVCIKGGRREGRERERGREDRGKGGDRRGEQSRADKLQVNQTFNTWKHLRSIDQ